MITTKNVANAVGGKTARACDACVKRRARWYCASDDAFLCQTCDSSVHSANPLARRHERVRLKSASSVAPTSATWHHGFTKKPRTPRHGKKLSSRHYSFPVHDLVPDLCSDDQMSHGDNNSNNNDDDRQLLYRVPVFEPYVAEKHEASLNDSVLSKESCLNGFFPSDKELEEFAADMETLLGKGLESEPFAMEKLGLGDHYVCYREPSLVKIEEGDTDDLTLGGSGGDFGNNYTDDHHLGPLDLSFDYDSNNGDEDENKGNLNQKRELISVAAIGDEGELEKEKKEKKKVPLLRLDYEGVVSEWGGKGPPWTGGDRPDFDPNDDCWPGCTGTTEEELQRLFGGMGGARGGIRAHQQHQRWGDGGREARVSRYREKRRTRLFSKKIRYEVRKLNAEKRPRMKGRFVKRASFSAPSYPIP